MNIFARRLLGFAAGLFSAGTVSAQVVSYVDVTATHLPPGLAGMCMDAAAADADGDGDLDLALAMEFQPNILLLNDGAGRFMDASGRLPRAVHDSEDVAFADFDGDGDLDLVFVSEDDRTDELYINDGTGRYTDASERLPTDDTSNALAVIDLDGDGVPDLLTGNVGVNRVLIGDGRGGFRDETAQRWPQVGESRTQDLELADVDGDGDLDVVVGNEGRNQLFVNDNGRLAAAAAGSLPVHDDETRKIRAADVDGDGDLDLLVANVSFALDASPQDYLLLNDGSGAFTAAEPERFPEDARSNFTIQVADLDGDGDLDVLAPPSAFPTSLDEYLIVVTDASGSISLVRAEDIDIRDVDDDGDLDFVAADGDRSRTFLSDAGRLVAADDGGAAPSRTLTFRDVDFDEDGDRDFAIAGTRLDEALYPNAELLPGTLLPRPLSLIQLVDADFDGDIDLILASEVAVQSPHETLTLRNGGNGRFAAARTMLPADIRDNTFDIEIADFDADGVADIFFCNRASAPIPEQAARFGGLQRLLRGIRASD